MTTRNETLYLLRKCERNSRVNVVDVVKREFVVRVVPLFPIGTLSAIVAVSTVREACIPLGQMSFGYEPVDSHRSVGNDTVEQRGRPKSEREGEELHKAKSERLRRRLPKPREGSKAKRARAVWASSLLTSGYVAIKFRYFQAPVHYVP